MKTKKTVAYLILFTLTLGVLAPNFVQAKSKVALNKKSLTMTVGQKKTLKVKGTKKKAKWSSSKKKIATVSKKGLVKAKKAGKTTITAKIKKKKYRCRVTVKKKESLLKNTVSNTEQKVAVLDTNEMAKNIDVSVEKTLSGLLFIVKNNNSTWISDCKLNYSVRTSNDEIISNSNEYCRAIAPGQTIYKSAYISKGDLMLIDISKTVISKTVERYASFRYEDKSAEVNVKTSENMVGTHIPFEVKNNSATDVDCAIAILYYDKDGILVDAESTRCFLKANETKMDMFYPSYEYDDDFNKVTKFASFKVVSYAYAEII